jgi:hypothetical protein
MIKLKINQNFKSLINSLLINSNKLNNSFYILNNNLIINRQDLEEVDNILTRNSYKYSITK